VSAQRAALRARRALAPEELAVLAERRLGEPVLAATVFTEHRGPRGLVRPRPPAAFVLALTDTHLTWIARRPGVLGPRVGAVIARYERSEIVVHTRRRRFSTLLEVSAPAAAALHAGRVPHTADAERLLGLLAADELARY